MRKKTRILALCLFLTMVFSLGMPTAFAEGNEPAAEIAEQPGEPATPRLPHVHLPELVLDVAPSCVDKGQWHWECSSCGEVLSRYETEKDIANHVGPTYAVNESQPGVNLDLLHSLRCQACGRLTGGTAPHNKVAIPAVAPTCTVAGSTEGQKCADCGRIFKAPETIDALGHDYVDYPAKAPTCTEPGYEAYTQCSRCGDYKIEKVEIPALGHEMGKWEIVKEATCADEGLEESKCTRCEFAEAKEIPKLDHTWGEWKVTKEPTCTTDGVKSRICSVCKAEDTGVIPAAHTWGEWKVTTEPTCTADGEQTRICSVCEVTETQPIKALGHKEVTVPGKAPTCTEDGLTDGLKCSVCDTTLKEQEPIPATGHKEVAIPDKAATCTEDGSKGGTKCSVCGEILEQPEVIPAFGHKWGSWSDYKDGKHHVRTCENDPSHKDYGRHIMGNWVIGKYNTETTDGYKERWCQVDGCDYHETQIIRAGSPKTGDSSNILLFSGLCLLSACGAVGVLFYVKKKKEQ